MTRGRLRVLLATGWIATGMFLIYVAGVPAWLAFIGNVLGAVVIHRYAPRVTGGTLSRAEKALRIGGYVILGAILAFLVLVALLTTFAFLGTLISN
jgi:hypothetical protein